MAARDVADLAKAPTKERCAGGFTEWAKDEHGLAAPWSQRLNAYDLLLWPGNRSNYDDAIT